MGSINRERGRERKRKIKLSALKLNCSVSGLNWFVFEHNWVYVCGKDFPTQLPFWSRRQRQRESYAADIARFWFKRVVCAKYLPCRPRRQLQTRHVPRTTTHHAPQPQPMPQAEPQLQSTANKATSEGTPARAPTFYTDLSLLRLFWCVLFDFRFLTVLD